MGPSPTLLPFQPWKKDPYLINLLEIFEKEGLVVRFVGGCVRDAYLNRPVADIDLAADKPPQTIQKVLETHGIPFSSVGIEHGTLTAILPTQEIQITTLRRDIETHGRHAVVQFTSSWEEDAWRRDFTLNALYADLHGHLWDPSGQGLQDLQQGRLRFMGIPEKRLQEDGLRLLRFFRFSGIYARGPLDKQGLTACIQNKTMLRVLSGQRIFGEMKKIYATPRASEILGIMRDKGILQEIFPFILENHWNFESLKILQSIEMKIEETASFFARLSFSLSDKNLSLVSKTLKLSRKHEHALLLWEKPDIQESLKASDCFEQVVLTDSNGIKPVPALKVWLYRYGPEVTRDIILLYGTHGIQQNPQRQCSEVFSALMASMKESFRILMNWKKPVFPLNGFDLVALGIPFGPQRKHLLKTVEDWWIKKDFAPCKEQCLDYLMTEITKHS